MISEARVHTGRNNIFTVATATGMAVCRLKGKVLQLEERAYNPLAPGDTVEVDLEEGGQTGVIVSRLPRRNAFSRFNTKRSSVQTLAANIDLVVVIASVSDPPFNADFVDRATVLASLAGVESVVVVNKRDLDEVQAENRGRDYQSLGFTSVTLSNGDRELPAVLRVLLEHKRATFVGQSGVGKSTVLNSLVGESVQQTAAVSERHRSGRHTTNAAELVVRGAYELIDTPGVRELDCRHLDSSSLDVHFREFVQFLGRCGHSDCLHDTEPDCAVIAAVEAGRIPVSRFESYLRVLREVREREEYDW